MHFRRKASKSGMWGVWGWPLGWRQGVWGNQHSSVSGVHCPTGDAAGVLSASAGNTPYRDTSSMLQSFM